MCSWRLLVFYKDPLKFQQVVSKPPLRLDYWDLKFFDSLWLNCFDYMNPNFILGILLWLIFSPKYNTGFVHVKREKQFYNHFFKVSYNDSSNFEGFSYNKFWVSTKAWNTRSKPVKAILAICYVFFILLNVFSQKLWEWPSTPMAKENCKSG